MNKEIITKREYETILELNGDNSRQFEMLEEFALKCANADVPAVKLAMADSRRIIKAQGLVGLLSLNDGTQVEIIPRIGEDTANSRLILCKMISVHLGIPFDERLYASCGGDSTFLEYFAALFVKESMKIVKSGMLSGYATVEENTTAMQGSIIFPENIRRNLTHRERLYVRHDVFTPDRAENRLMKTTAEELAKLSRDPRNLSSIKKLMANLDEVKRCDNIDSDLAKCINTRNTKKYSAVLSLCRLILGSRSRRVTSGRYVSFSVFFSMQDIFEDYVCRLVKVKNRERSVVVKPKGIFLCGSQKKFSTAPHVVIYDGQNNVQCIMNAKWSNISSSRDIADEDIFRLYTSAKMMGCHQAMLIYPRTSNVTDMPKGSVYFAGDVTIHVIFEPLSAVSEAYMITEETAPEVENEAVEEYAPEEVPAVETEEVQEAENAPDDENDTQNETETVSAVETETTADTEHKRVVRKVKLVRKK